MKANVKKVKRLFGLVLEGFRENQHCAGGHRFCLEIIKTFYLRRVITILVLILKPRVV